jgi:hypothetical protein
MEEKANSIQNMAKLQTFLCSRILWPKGTTKGQCLPNNFHGANAAIDLTTALDHLALAATTNREIVAQLTHANDQLTTTNKVLTEQLQKLLVTNASLVNKLGTTIPTSPPTTNAGGRKPFDQSSWEAKLDPKGYCWTHGYRPVYHIIIISVTILLLCESSESVIQ